MTPSLRRRLVDGPPLSALGLVWPWVAPWRILAARGRAEAEPGGPRFTVLSSNALGKNPRATDYAATVAAIEADVIVVVEASDRILDALEAAEIQRHHGPGVVERGPRYDGAGIWSTHPVERLEAGDICDRGHAYLAVRVHLPQGPVDVLAVHTYAPVHRGTGRLWRQSFDTLAEVVKRLDGPVVAAGDWNATLGHRPLRDFLQRTGLRDAHTAAGRGLARSWPVWQRMGPVGLIDRAAVSDELGVAAVEERRLPGSDHLAVLTTLAVRPRAAAAPR